MSQDTIRIKHGDTFKVIAKRNFDDNKHEVWQEEQQKGKPQPTKKANSRIAKAKNANPGTE